jgi:hypothetical protein
VRWWALVVVGACVRAAPVAAAPLESMAISDGVVLTPGQKVVYVMADKGIVALDVASGRVRWTSAKAAKPLVQAGPALVALADSGQLVLLDAGSGKAYTKCPTIAGVTIDFFQTINTTSTSTGAALDGHVRISWAWTSSYPGGATPAPGEPSGTSQSGSGSYEIDVARCTATPGPPLPAVFENRSEQGKTIGVVKLRDGSETQLVRLNTGGLHLVHGAIDVDVFARDPKDITYSITADRRAVVVGSPAGARELAFYDLATGRLVLRGTCEAFPYAAQLVGSVVVTVLRDVAACDVATGKTLWRQPLRNVNRGGSLPP